MVFPDFTCYDPACILLYGNRGVFRYCRQLSVIGYKSRLGYFSGVSCISWHWVVCFAWAALFPCVLITTQGMGLRNAQLLLQNALRSMEKSCHVLGRSCIKMVIFGV